MKNIIIIIFGIILIGILIFFSYRKETIEKKVIQPFSDLVRMTPVINKSSFWIKPEGNPILVPSQSWEEKSVFEPTVLYENNEYKMWYSGGGKCAVGYATSRDGVNWIKYDHNPILGHGNGGEKGMACRNNVIKYKNLYYLYYVNDTRDLYIATSKDGIHFSKHSEAVLRHVDGSWENNLANSFQWVEGNKWYMIYESGGSDGLGLWRMGLAMGNDPFTWKKYNKNPLTSLQVGKGMYGGPWVTKIDSKYYLFHQSTVAADNLPTDIYIHSSSNLYDWELVSANPAVARTQRQWKIDQVADPYVISVKNRTYLYYDGDDNSAKTGYRAWIGYVFHDGLLKDIIQER